MHNEYMYLVYTNVSIRTKRVAILVRSQPYYYNILYKIFVIKKKSSCQLFS